MRRFTELLLEIGAFALLATACSDEPEHCYGSGATETVVDSRRNLEAAATAASGSVRSGADCSELCQYAKRMNTGRGWRLAECKETAPATDDAMISCTFSDEVRCYDPGVVEGRRPAGLAMPEYGCSNPLGRLFASMTHLEAASVHAFTRLYRELKQYAAPHSLLEQARCAIQDEVRHARLMFEQAARYGAKVPRVEVAPFVKRSLFEIAAENEREGCVRETYAVLVALYQAKHAATPELRALFAEIARDEARHAELAWRVREFLLQHLSHEERSQLDGVRLEALQELQAELATPTPDAWRVAGLPGPSSAQRLFLLLVQHHEFLSEAVRAA